MKIKLLLPVPLLLLSVVLSAQSWKQLDDSISYYYYGNDLDKTALVAEKAITAAKNEFGEDHYLYAMALNKLAQLYSSMEQYEKAIPVFEQTIKVAIKTLKDDYPATYFTVVAGLGGVYGYMGQLEKTEKFYLEAREIAKEKLGVKHPYYSKSLAALADLYNSMKEYKRSEPLYQQSLEVARKISGEDNTEYMSRLAQLAGVYENMEEYEKAESLYWKVLSFYTLKKERYPKDYATCLNNLAAIYHATGQYEKAEPLYLASMEAHKKSVGELHPLYSSSLNNLGLLYFDKGEYEKAEPLLFQNSLIDLATLKREIAVLSEKEKQEYLSHAVSLPGTQNSVVYSSPKKLFSLIKNNFNLQLILKSLTLTDSRSMLSAVRQSGDTAIQQLLAAWQTKKTELAKQYSLPLKERRKDLRELEETAEDLEKQLNRRSTIFRNQQAALQVSMTEIRENLIADEVAIEFVSFKLYNKRSTDSTIYAAYILAKKDSVPVFVPLFEERQLQKLLDSAGNDASTIVNSFYRGTELKNKSAATVLGKQLYTLVWAPLEPYLQGIKRISYSPAGKLFSIAFQALPVDSNTLLMDKYKLQQYLSTRQVALRNSGTEAKRPSGIGLFGDAVFTQDSTELLKRKRQNNTYNIYTAVNRSGHAGIWAELPGTAEEVKKIQKLFEQNGIASNLFVKADANEERLKSISDNSPQVLHIATHGFFLPPIERKKKDAGRETAYTLADEPLLRSGLILAGGNYAWSGKTPIEGVEDGIVTAYEISQLNLSNTELVVLSACETALGDVKGSEGVFGLQRAFKMAGVKKMIVSLWQVPDKETAELMTAFYTYWIKGATISDAFGQAQAEMRKKYSPFYWAAFVLIE
jgi:CHAT domain-containing protein